MFLGACEARLSVLMYKHSALFSKRKTLGAYTTEWWRDAQSKSSSHLIPLCICGELQDCTLGLCSIALPCPLKPASYLTKLKVLLPPPQFFLFPAPNSTPFLPPPSVARLPIGMHAASSMSRQSICLCQFGIVFSLWCAWVVSLINGSPLPFSGSLLRDFNADN